MDGFSAQALQMELASLEWMGTGEAVVAQYNRHLVAIGWAETRYDSPSASAG